MRSTFLSLSLGASFIFAATAAQAAIVVVPFTGDASSGISSSNIYTHLLDFVPDGNPAVINGVTFTAAGTSDSGSASPYSLFFDRGAPASFGGSSNTDGTSNLLSDFYYNGSGQGVPPIGSYEIFTLGGLIPGTSYDLRFYSRSFNGVNGGRLQDVGVDTNGDNDFSDQALAGYDEDINGIHYLSITYTPANGVTSVGVKFTETTSNNSYHVYGLSNQVVVPEPTTGMALLSGMGLLGAARRRRA